MNSLDLIKDIKNEEMYMPEIVMPIFKEYQSSTVIINQKPYQVMVTSKNFGYYIVQYKPLLSNIIRVASQVEIRNFLDTLPKIRAIIIGRVNDIKKMIFPESIIDAELKGFYIEPSEVILSPEELESFTIISVRKWNDDLLYDSILEEPNIQIIESLNEGIEDPTIFNTTITGRINTTSRKELTKEQQIVYNLLLNPYEENLPESHDEDEEEYSDYESSDDR